MDFDEQIGPYTDAKVDNIQQQSGVVDTLPALPGLDIDLPDKAITANLDRRIEDSLAYWNDPKGFNLKVSRNHMTMMHLGKQVDESRLYRYQIPYIENEMFVGFETMVAYLTSQAPQPETYPGQDTDSSRILSGDLEKALMAHSEKFNIARLFENAVRDCLNKRLGCIYFEFDPDYGDFGEIIPKSIDPEHLIIDKNARMGENPEFICYLRKTSVEKLITRYPEKEKEILEACGFKYKTLKQMTTEIVYREVWITYYEKGEAKEGCVSYFGTLVLGKYKNPHWIYTKGKFKNFLDMPLKPFIPLNNINDGAHWIDQTSPMEQASLLQDILNKRGRQIMENADTANGIQIFDSAVLTKDDAEMLTGDPNQKIIVNASTQGMKVGDTVMNVLPHQLPAFVINDKIDLRNTIHSIIGTPSQFRGDDSADAKTATENIMIKNQAAGRQDILVRKIDQFATAYFRYLTQMMKVHYTDKHYFVYNGGDGEFDYITMHRGLIEEGVQVSVKSGATLPFDKQRQQAVALQLAQMGAIDPLNLYKDLGMDNPQKRYDALMKWKTQPQELAKNALDELQDQAAFVDYIEIMDGKLAKPRDDADTEHILTHRKQMISDKFLKAKPEQQMALIAHVQAEVSSLERRTQLDLASQSAVGGMGLDVNAPLPSLMPQPQAGPQGMPPPGMQGPPQGAPPPSLSAIGGQPQPVNAGNPSQLPVV